MLVEFGKSKNRIDYIRLLVHDDNCSSTETTLAILEIIKVHKCVITLFLSEALDRGTSWNDSFEIVPATYDTLAMSLDEFLEWDTHFLLYSDWVVDVTTDTEELGSGITLSSETCEPACASSHDGWANSNSLNISDLSGSVDRQ